VRGEYHNNLFIPFKIPFEMDKKEKPVQDKDLQELLEQHGVFGAEAHYQKHYDSRSLDINHMERDYQQVNEFLRAKK
jgi:hypothetical protein